MAKEIIYYNYFFFFFETKFHLLNNFFNFLIINIFTHLFYLF